MGGEGGTVGGDVVQVVAVPWGWYFRGTVEMVPWEVVLCRYREGGTLGTTLWWYRGGCTLAVPWDGKPRRYHGGTVDPVPWQYCGSGTVAIP